MLAGMQVFVLFNCVWCGVRVCVQVGECTCGECVMMWLWLATVLSKKLVEFLSLHTRKGLHLCFSPAHLAGVACTGSLGLVCPQLVQGGEEESE